MSPGTTVRPRRSMTSVAGGTAAGCAGLATDKKRPLRMVTVLATVFRASRVWMRPLTSIKSGAGPSAEGAIRGDCPASLETAKPAPAAVPRNLRRENEGIVGMLGTSDRKLARRGAAERPDTSTLGRAHHFAS